MAYILLASNLEEVDIRFTEYNNFRSIIAVLQTANRLQQHFSLSHRFSFNKLVNIKLAGMDPDGRHCLNFRDVRPISQL